MPRLRSIISIPIGIAAAQLRVAPPRHRSHIPPMPFVQITWLPKACRTAAVRQAVADAVIKAIVGVKGAEAAPANVVVRESMQRPRRLERATGRIPSSDSVADPWTFRAREDRRNPEHTADRSVCHRRKRPHARRWFSDRADIVVGFGESVDAFPQPKGYSVRSPNQSPRRSFPLRRKTPISRVIPRPPRASASAPTTPSTSLEATPAPHRHRRRLRKTPAAPCHIVCTSLSAHI